MEVSTKAILIGISVFVVVGIIIAVIIYFITRKKPIPSPSPNTKSYVYLQALSPQQIAGLYFKFDQNKPIALVKDMLSATPIYIALDDESTLIGKTFPIQYVRAYLEEYINVVVNSTNVTEFLTTDYFLDFQNNPSFASQDFASLFIDQNMVLSAYFRNNKYLTAQVDDKSNVIFNLSNSDNDITVVLKSGDSNPVPSPTSTFTPPVSPILYTYLQCKDPQLNLSYYLIFNDGQTIAKTLNVTTATPMNCTTVLVQLNNFLFSIAPLLTNDGQYITISGDISSPNNHIINFTDNFVYNEGTKASLFLCPDQTIKAFFDKDHCYQLHAENGSFFMTFIVEFLNNSLVDNNFITIFLIDTDSQPQIIPYINSYLTLMLNGTKYYLQIGPNKMFNLIEGSSFAQKFLISYGQINCDQSTPFNPAGVRNIFFILDEFGNYFNVNLTDMTISKSQPLLMWPDNNVTFDLSFKNPWGYEDFFQTTNSLYLNSENSSIETCNRYVETLISQKGHSQQYTAMDFLLRNDMQFTNLQLFENMGLKFNVELTE